MSSLLPESCRTLLRAGFPVAAILLLAGCQKGAAPPPAPKPPVEVKFVHPVQAPVTPYEEFGGRALSPETVELRSRVSGYLTSVNFKDGQDVKKGDVLFEIEDTVYKASLAQSEATVKEREADIGRLKSQLDRAKRLMASQATTDQEVERLTFEVAGADAARAAAVALRDRAKLDVAFTHVVAPITGRIGRRLVDPGNLVQADTTPLATVVSLDPIYAYFDYDERSVLQMRRLVEQGRLTEAPDRNQPIGLALAGETQYLQSGKINWVDNQIDMGTGTLRARVEVSNPKGLISPGMFVRLRVPVGPEEQALMVPEEALGADQGQRYVYVINGADEIEYRRVEVGLLSNGMQVVESGISAGDRVVVTGLQRVRRNTKVKATLREPDSSTAEGNAAKPDTPPPGPSSPAVAPPAAPPSKPPETPVSNVAGAPPAGSSAATTGMR